MTPLEQENAPDFELPDQNGQLHKLSDFLGQWVLLYFYPKDGTPGCIEEAKAFREQMAGFNKLEIKVLGVSADTLESHKKFEKEFGLNFTLLADPEKKAIGLYGADGVIFPKRISYLINPSGKIEKFYAKVSPASHAKEILEYLSREGIEG